jgi:hypothetical protein
MHHYGSGVLLLVKLVLYPACLYHSSSDEYAAFAVQLALMPRFAAFVSIVSTVFEMMMLQRSCAVQLLRPFASQCSAAALQLAALQAADVLWDLCLPHSPPAANEAGEEDDAAAGEEYNKVAEGRPCF